MFIETMGVAATKVSQTIIMDMTRYLKLRDEDIYNLRNHIEYF